MSIQSVLHMGGVQNTHTPGVRGKVVLHGLLVHREQARVLVHPRGTALLVLASFKGPEYINSESQ